MKHLPLFVFGLLLQCLHADAQSLNELLSAPKGSDKMIQAIHTYPANIEDGNCHWVPVSLLELNGNKIKIVESWKSAIGKAQTVLTGTVINGVATGIWSSTFSSGSWSYDFNTGTGQWNKTKTIAQLKVFKVYQLLRFRIVARKDIRDGEFSCN